MEKKIAQEDLINLVGISVRTSNTKEFNPETAKISATMQKFFSLTKIKINNQISPNKIFAVYTNYEGDHKGEYTYFIGQEGSNFENLEQDLERISIPAQTYTKFTSTSGKMPDVVIDTWKQIWQMTDQSLNRSYTADFEVYDERSYDLNNAVVDIYIAIKE